MTDLTEQCIEDNTPHRESTVLFADECIKMTETVKIEKEVWESTLNRSMVLQAENYKLKELLKECRDEINPYIEVVGGKKTFKNLIDKINEVLK